MLTLIKQIFTWWNQQTIGTWIYTLIFGKKKGSDEFGNKYYESKYSTINSNRYKNFKNRQIWKYSCKKNK